MFYFPGAGTGPMVDAQAIAMQRNAGGRDEALTRAAQVYMQKKQLQAQEDSQLRQIGFETDAMKQREQARRDEQDQQNKQFMTQLGFQGGQADANRQMQQQQFGATNDRLSAAALAAQAHQSRADDIQQQLAAGNLNYQQAQMEHMKNDQAHQQRMDDVVTGNAADTHARSAFELDQAKNDPQNLIKQYMSKALQGSLGGDSGGNFTAQPSTPAAPQSTGYGDDTSYGGDAAGGSGSTFNTDAGAPAMPTQPPAANPMPQAAPAQAPGMSSIMNNPMLRSFLKLPDPDTQNFNKQMQMMQLEQMKYDTQAKRNAAEGILPGAQNKAMHANMLAQAQQELDQAAGGHAFDDESQQNQILAEIRNRANQRLIGQGATPLGDAELIAPKVTDQMREAAIGKALPGEDLGAMYKRALDSVVKADPELHGGLMRFGDTSAETADQARAVPGVMGVWGSSPVVSQDPYYQKTHANDIIRQMIRDAAQNHQVLAPRMVQQIYNTYAKR